MDGRARLLVAGCLVSGAILALMLLSPLLSHYGAFRGLDGSPGFIDGGWEGEGPAGIAYLLGDLFCHQEESRSLFLNGSQMPVCARDTGILIGLPAGFAACLLIRGRLADRRIAILGVVLVAVMVAEWCVETAGFDSQACRLASGVSAGVGASLFLAWMLYRQDDGRERLGVRLGVRQGSL